MEWGQSYSATWKVFRVNRSTWADAEELKSIDEVSVSRTADGSLLESGSMELSGEFTSDYYRIVMVAEQGGEVTRVDVATLLFDVTGGTINYGRTVHDVDGFSVLYPASKTTILAGEFAPKGVDGAEYAAELLRKAVNAPVSVEGSFILNDYLVHDIGSSVLEAAWNVLKAGNFIIQIDGRGVIHIRPMPTDPSLIIDNSSRGIMMSEISFATDISDVPNRYIVIVDNNKTVAVNNDPESMISISSRGYCVDHVDESPTPVNGETLSAYANRRLRELSVEKEEKTYTREYAADVHLYSIVRASIDGMAGDYRINSQTIECGKGITVQEKAVKEVPLW